MKCVYCAHTGSRVVDSRPAEDGASVRRKRVCEACGRRFLTVERAERVPLAVVKRDKTRERFEIGKLRASIAKAFGKRPAADAQIRAIADEIERRICREAETEVASAAICEMAMDALFKADEAAFARYALMRLKAQSLEAFADELGRMIARKQGSADENVRGDIQIR